MPITKTTGYLASDGVVYASIEQAQTAELRKLLETVDGCGMFPTQSIDHALDRVAADLLNHRDDLLAILTTGPRSRPAARKRAGTTNPKRATRAQAQAGFKAMRDAASGGTNATHDADVAAEPAAA